MTSRNLFAIRLVLLSILLWQLGSYDCAYAKLHGNSGTTNTTNAGSAQNAEITQLEQKFFQHDYSTDSTDQRLERLEKMVFGKVGTGSDTQRLAALKEATVTSALESQPTDSNNRPTASNQESPATAATDTATSKYAHKGRKPPADTRNEIDEANKANDDNTAGGNGGSGDLTQYPAVTAIEKRLFGKDYANDSITKRLDRLELKQFGAVSNSDDLSERMDKLKQATGIDIAKEHSSGSDWADEDDLSFTDAQGVGKITPFTPDAVEDGGNINNFIGDGPQSFQGEYGGTGYGGTGYGGGYSGGGYGSGYTRAPHTTPVTAQPRMGLDQEVNALEKEVFGKNYTREALPERVKRLEAAIFPQEKPATDKSLPDRVARLMAAVPLSDDSQQNASNGQGQNRHGLKLSKMFGNMLGFTGSYPGNGMNNLSVDPQTGLLYNNSTGQLIDPSTGAVIGQRMGSTMGGVAPWGFGSGMSPFGTMPYGYGAGGMGGMGFGMGRMGVGGLGGMW